MNAFDFDTILFRIVKSGCRCFVHDFNHHSILSALHSIKCLRAIAKYKYKYQILYIYVYICIGNNINVLFTLRAVLNEKECSPDCSSECIHDTRFWRIVQCRIPMECTQFSSVKRLSIKTRHIVSINFKLKNKTWSWREIKLLSIKITKKQRKRWKEYTKVVLRVAFLYCLF